MQLTEEDKKWIDGFVEQNQARFTKVCEKCKGTGRFDFVPVPEQPQASFNMPCDYCDRRSILHRAAVQIRHCVPSAYQFAVLGRLQPSDKSGLSIERQQKIIDAIKAEPNVGWSFFGPPGIGKTVWTTALFINALWKHTLEDNGDLKRSVWRIDAKTMLDEHSAYATMTFEDEIQRIINQPTVTPEKITFVRAKQSQTPRLFLEEIDKLPKETEFRRAVLFSIIDALQANDGQLVLNSNLTPEEFAQRFGEDLWWRIKKMTKIVSLFE